ncbi:hypothetical protein EUX98_g3230 [Antrodiella citrinella]|uniref:Protein kinase domain-containing protein n=1 Tax=Antrodiella citrinella TaxID=2447956 RepID=A0A4S4MYA2_9APHY|nr:hypothetical protein EUX98_g3230 [Antrodiella citrinella]
MQEDSKVIGEAWKHFVGFLAMRGYELCFSDWFPDGGTSPWRPRPLLPVAQAPFRPATNENFVYEKEDRLDRYPSSWFEWIAVIRHAYDRLGRMLIVKVVQQGHNETRILQYLNSTDLRCNEANHTIPLIDCVDSGIGWAFIVMPCWNSKIMDIFVWQVNDYLETAIHAFVGLAFMHEHRVFHRDISYSNITNNHIGNWEQTDFTPFPSISTFDYRVAFIDFGLATQFHKDTPMADCTANDWRGTPSTMAPEIAAYDPLVESTPYEIGPGDVFALASALLRELQEETTKRSFLDYSNESESIVAPPFYEGVYAQRVLLELIPAYQRVMDAARSVDPKLRPTASEALD